MSKRLILSGAVAVLGAVLGVGFAASSSPEQPTRPPNPTASEVMLAGKDGNALRCAGVFVQVSRASLGGSTPTLLPEQAVEAQARARGGAPVDPALVAPAFESFSCARNALGQETGDVLAQVREPSGRRSTRTIPTTNR